MDNLMIYNAIFITVFHLDEAQLNETLRYESVSRWDSIGQIRLIAELEDAFGITFSEDDAMVLDSYQKGIELLHKYNVVM